MPAPGWISLRWAGMKPAPTNALCNYLEEDGHGTSWSIADLHRYQARFRDSHASSLSNSDDRLAAHSPLTWCPGQWHPASDQHQVLGATDLGFVRSVLDLADYSSFDREQVSRALRHSQMLVPPVSIQPLCVLDVGIGQGFDHTP